LALAKPRRSFRWYKFIRVRHWIDGPTVASSGDQTRNADGWSRASERSVWRAWNHVNAHFNDDESSLCVCVKYCYSFHRLDWTAAVLTALID